MVYVLGGRMIQGLKAVWRVLLLGKLPDDRQAFRTCFRPVRLDKTESDRLELCDRAPRAVILPA